MRVVALGAGSTLFLPASVKRTGIVLSPPGAGRYTITDAGVAVLDQGITMTSGAAPLQLWIRETGTWITKQLQVIHSAGGVSVGVLEVFGPGEATG